MPINRRKFLKFTGLGLGGALALPKTAQASKSADHTGRHIAMLYDTTKCIGCHACSNACRDWNSTTPEPDPSGLYDAPQDLSGDTWTIIQVYEGEGEYSFVKHQCMHCVEPACVSACPVHALHKTETGAVVYSQERCIGCRYCMVACPFHIPRFEWDEVLPRIVKCTLCSDRLLEEGQGPRCAEICPTGALIWGHWEDLLAEAEERLAAHPDRYVNHVYGKDEVGGTSVFYLSHVPFEKLGLPDYGHEPAPELSDNVAVYGTPSALLGVAGLLTGVYWVTKRRADE